MNLLTEVNVQAKMLLHGGIWMLISLHLLSLSCSILIFFVWFLVNLLAEIISSVMLTVYFCFSTAEISHYSDVV
jgi:hypothetical protein